MPLPITIRPLKRSISDRVRFSFLAKAADARPLSWGWSRARSFTRSKKSLLLLAEKGKSRVGYIGAKRRETETTWVNDILKGREKDLAHLSWIAVVPKVRGEGVARILVDRTITWAKDHGEKGLWLTCLEDRLAFWGKFGFQPVGSAVFAKENKKAQKRHFVLVRTI